MKKQNNQVVFIHRDIKCNEETDGKMIPSYVTLAGTVKDGFLHVGCSCCSVEDRKRFSRPEGRRLATKRMHIDPKYNAKDGWIAKIPFTPLAEIPEWVQVKSEMVKLIPDVLVSYSNKKKEHIKRIWSSLGITSVQDL